MLVPETPAYKISGNTISESLKDLKGEKRTLKNMSFHFTFTVAIIWFFSSTNCNLSIFDHV